MPCRGLLGTWASWWQGSRELRAAERLSNTERRETLISTCLEAAEAWERGLCIWKPIREVPQGARGAARPRLTGVFSAGSRGRRRPALKLVRAEQRALKTPTPGQGPQHPHTDARHTASISAAKTRLLHPRIFFNISFFFLVIPLLNLFPYF